ncbi:hemin uptake protein HemP [Thermomonas carbonis]|uniref:Hemin uptake protein HemP n=1 Tax=Thermomonas carbonis TaxID=1463158 RepID=A0A7G9SUG3_9GAMM|nr:hemin uptake protein HemP [Thermomonas carbonis]
MSAILESRPRLTRHLVLNTPCSPRITPVMTPTVESRSLLKGCNEVLIHHGNEVYRLRHTRNDKLILTK